MKVKIFIVALMLFLALVSCTERIVFEKESKFTVAQPKFDPPGGTYYTGQLVSITCETEGSEIYYTLDGSEPTISSILYTESIEVSKPTTIKARAFKKDWRDSKIVTATYNISLNMVFVEGGSFQMGSVDGWNDEKPVHTVTLNSFYISKYKLTQMEWIEVMDSNPSNWKEVNLPVEQVSWYDVIDYCNKRSVKEGLTPCYSINGNTNPSDWTSETIVCNWNADGYRLPTEAEWEYAARGGNQSNGYTYSGSNNLDDVGWYASNSSNKTHPVGEKKANELGIYDMSGNVWEWCWDWYNSSYYYSSPTKNPKGPESGSYRVRRGGSYNYDDFGCRVAYRFFYSPSVSFNVLGFRLVKKFP